MQEQYAAEAAQEVRAEPKEHFAVDRVLAPYRIGPGDVLNITLTGLDQPTVSTIVRVRIDRDGEADLPLVGSVKIGWMEETDAEETIKAAYVPNVVRQLSVTVEVAVFETTNVLVTGAVTAPGLVALRRTQCNILYAVLGAGGISELASGEVTLGRIRRPLEKETFTLTDPVELEEALAADALENGDIIYVEAAVPNTIYVGGLVNRPAPQPYSPGVQMNILQVLAGAGGLRPDLLPSEGTLIRRMPDGTDVRVKLDFNRIQRGDDPNIMLAAGDILWVPETIETRIIDFFNRNFFIRGGVSITYSATGTEFLNSRAKAVQLRGLGAGGGESQFDPFGFLLRNAALQGLSAGQ